MLTVARCAKLAGISERMITQYCKARTLPAENFGRAWAIKEADFASWMLGRIIAARTPGLGRPITQPPEQEPKT